ncbi:hypothetical protein BH10PSE15_BH10PSE15_12780 [soil metagenome]
MRNDTGLKPSPARLPGTLTSDLRARSAAFTSGAGWSVPKPLITLVLPFYNEAGYIEWAIDSLARQTDRRFTLVLVDNASTDDSVARARSACTALADIEVRFLREAKPGKINALVAGAADIDTIFIATLDADTLYPPEYVANCLRLFCENPDAAAVMAIGIGCTLGPVARRRALWLTRLGSQILRSKCHSGAYAQSFRTAAFRAAGGYDRAIWDYVLEDHEIVHRIACFGRLVYDSGHFCTTSDRRADRSNVSWSLGERLLYAVAPASSMQWYFHGFLRKRFERRKLFNLNLRAHAPRPVQSAETAPPTALVTQHASLDV